MVPQPRYCVWCPKPALYVTSEKTPSPSLRYSVGVSSEKLVLKMSSRPSPLWRRFACACLDWRERRPHVGGALGAALLKIALERKWIVQNLDSRALSVTSPAIQK